MAPHDELLNPNDVGQDAQGNGERKGMQEKNPIRNPHITHGACFNGRSEGLQKTL